MNSLSETYYGKIRDILDRVVETNRDVLRDLGPLVGRSIAGGGILHTFGSGHSEIISREIIGRAGGLVPVSGITDPTAGMVENLPGYGTKLAERYTRLYGMKKGEAILVISNSGKNCAPIEVAMHARSLGLLVIGISSMTMTKQVQSEHPSGKKLCDIADHMLDNCGIPGDAVVDLPGIDVRAGPTSTLCGALLANLLQMEVLSWMAAEGMELPVLRSQNLKGSVERNRALSDRYPGRLSKPVF